MPIAGVVADANVLLSAAIGKAALRVFTDFEVHVHACRFNCAEVEEYLPVLARRYRIEPELVAMQWRLLPIRVHGEESYASSLAEAPSRMAGRDPDDAHQLALALLLGIPLWSNDSDVRDRGVTVYPTAELLAILDAEAKSSQM